MRIRTVEFQKMSFIGFVIATLFCTCYAAPQNYQTTPVPILKQINQQNDDGSYSYGFKAADGTFKIETKFATGEVYGKYGYVGDDGRIRVVEYGASKRGFEPKGSDINVAPPTLDNDVEDVNYDGNFNGDYRDDLKTYEKNFAGAQKYLHSKDLKAAFPNHHRQVHFYQPNFYQVQPKFKVHRGATARTSNFIQQNHIQPRPQRIIYNPSVFNGHPATNIDLNTGSFTVSYSS